MQIRVDRRVELVSILFHLAGTPEYEAFETPYRRTVDAFFASFREHAAVAATRELRVRYSISYNAPVSLAVLLDERSLLPLVDLDSATELDPRWHEVPIRAYLDHVRAFTADANVAGFFAEQQAHFDAVCQRLERALLDQDIEGWFASFLAHPAEAKFVVVPGLLTGPWNYEAATHDRGGGEVVFQVVELEGVDADGLPTPTRTTTELVAHEMAHSFVNPVVARHEADLVALAQPLYDSVREAMERLTYKSTRIMLEESLVRAITALFARDRLGVPAASQLALADVANGFSWNIELAKWLDGQPRPIDLERLIPELSRWLTTLAAQGAA